MSNNERSQFTYRLRKDIHPLIKKFCNMQDNLTDTLNYLIEKEIAQNGLRNLQEYIPTNRNILDGKSDNIVKQESKEAPEKDNSIYTEKKEELQEEIKIPSAYED